MTSSHRIQRRGFDTFFGYYLACQVDYWYHGAGAQACGFNGPGDPITDLSNSTAHPDVIAGARGLNGTYNRDLFANEAERLIVLHGAELASGVLPAGTPLYMYLAFQNVHSASTLPELTNQAPKGTVDKYATTVNDTWKVAGGMITELDAGVAVVLEALDTAGMLDNSVLAFCSDNGGPLDHATNAPLRGGKHTTWEGGLRVTAWVYSPLFPPASRGMVWNGMMYVRGAFFGVCLEV